MPDKVGAQLSRLSQVLSITELLAKTEPDAAMKAKISKARIAQTEAQQQQKQQQQGGGKKKQQGKKDKKRIEGGKQGGVKDGKKGSSKMKKLEGVVKKVKKGGDKVGVRHCLSREVSLSACCV